jgi:hypothetical protein
LAFEPTVGIGAEADRVLSEFGSENLIETSRGARRVGLVVESVRKDTVLLWDVSFYPDAKGKYTYR